MSTETRTSSAQHLAEAERLLGLADRLARKHTDREGRLILTGESAADLSALSALATAHAATATAIEAHWAREARGGI